MVKKASKKSALKKRPMAAKKKNPFETLVDRRRKRTFLLRLNDEEMAKLDELSATHNVSRSNVMRMLLKHGHSESVEKPLRAQAEVDVASEAARLATNERIDDLRKELLARWKVSDKTKKGARGSQ